MNKDTMYTLYEIEKNGLLLGRNGKPLTSKAAIRSVLQKCGIKPTFSSFHNQMTYQVKGEDLIKINQPYEQNKKDGSGASKPASSKK